MVNITKELEEMQAMEEKKRMSKEEIIMDTYNFYKNNPDQFSINEFGNCVYRTQDGKRCAVGRYMKEGKYQKFSGTASSLITSFTENEVFKPEVLGHPLFFWDDLQTRLHDAPAKSKEPLLELEQGLKYMLNTYVKNQKKSCSMEN